jgi:protein involved in polysaccharide export with SLBB domain
MKFYRQWIMRGLLVCGLPLAGFIFAGCASTNEPAFSDTPTVPPTITQSPTTGSPLANNGSDSDVARFHVGDTVTVTLSGLPDPIDPHTEPIKEDGTITMPDIGHIQAAGKTAGELQNAIHDLYVPNLYRHVTVNVSIGDRVYYVRGEVKNPGRQLYLGETTVTKAIASAGDFTDFANRRNVLLTRANGQQITVNCKKVLAGKETDPPVYPNDQIVVKKSIW